MERIIGFLYGLVAYLVFLVAFLYAIGFVTGLWVPKTLDTGPAGPAGQAFVIDLLLMSLFAVQHSVMARQPFKRWWTQFVPHVIERSTYVLLASLVLILLYWQWRPIPTIVWEITNPQIAMAVLGLSLAGWLLVLVSTFVINHFELFGLQQVVINLGFIIAFWAAPVMTVGHLLFAAVTTAYIFVGIFLEERDLVVLFGDDYRRYRERVAAVIPFWRKS
jgi:protein-S-isoprenylcysteine O-methyltransferase Ste14